MSYRPSKPDDLPGSAVDLSAELTVGSLTLASMGVAYVSSYFALFGLNAADFLTIGELTVFALREPLLVGYAAGFVILAAFLPQHRLTRLGCYAGGLVFGVICAILLAVGETASIRQLVERERLGGSVPVGEPELGRSTCTINLELASLERAGRRTALARTADENGDVNVTLLGRVGNRVAVYRDRSVFLISDEAVSIIGCPTK